MSHGHRRRILPRVSTEIHGKKRMNNSNYSRLRYKFWFIFFLLFVFWYALLYGFDWSSLPGLTSSLHHQEKPLQSIVTGSIHGEEALISDDSGTAAFSVDKLGNNSNDIDKNEKEESVVRNVEKEDSIGASSTEEGEGVNDVDDLEKELEPLFAKEDSKYGVEPDDGGENQKCAGRYIYVHDLPRRFNEDLLLKCKLLSKWSDMCQYLVNNGLGADLGNPGRIFSRTCWFNTNQFSLEVIFHNRMKQYECLTNDSSKAAAVFVPYYAGLDVSRYLWGSNKTMRDADSLDLTKWLRERPEWGVMQGRDHFMVAGRITWDFRRGVDEDYAWGNKLMNLPETKNMIVLTIESSPWNGNDFAIPYPTYFHPWKDTDVVQWQNRMSKLKRKSLFCFAGGPRPNMSNSIRGEIMDQCKSARRKCALIECTNKRNKCQKPDHIMRVFQNSIFCLQPPGDSFTRRSTFDSILAGCIPVFFTPASAYVQYLWHLPRDFTKYSVLIPEEEVKKKSVIIESVLSRISRTQVAAMREEVIKLIPNVVYADPRSRLHQFEDAFDLAAKGVIERVSSLRKEIREGRNSSLDYDEEESWKYQTFGITGKKHEWDHFFLRTNNK